MATMTRIVSACIVTMCLSHCTTGSPLLETTAEQRHKRDLHKFDDLESKLGRLQVLLKELEKEEDDGKSLAVTTPEVTSEPKDVREPMGDADSSQPGGDRDKAVIEKIAESLTPRDVETLKALKQMLGKARSLTTEDSKPGRLSKPDKGTFFDGPVSDHVDMPPITDKDTWRSLARQLQRQRDEYYLRKRTDDKSQIAVPAPEGGKFYIHTEEGGFLSLRDDIKDSVEKNLLNDIALAIDSGITVQEIINDLQERGKEAPGVWGAY